MPYLMLQSLIPVCDLCLFSSGISFPAVTTVIAQPLSQMAVDLRYIKGMFLSTLECPRAADWPPHRGCAVFHGDLRKALLVAPGISPSEVHSLLQSAFGVNEEIVGLYDAASSVVRKSEEDRFVV